MTDKYLELTKTQVVSATKKGGGSAMRKADALIRKIKKGKASKEEVVQYENIVGKLLKLIGEEVQGAEVTPGVPRSAEEEGLWIKAIEEQCHPYVVQYDNKEIGYSRLDELCKGITRQITGVDRMSGPCSRRLANMQRFRADSKHVKMFSHKLNKEIAVISKEDQRSMYKEMTTYTIDEAIALTERELDSDIAKSKVIDQVKVAIDGAVMRKGN
jgi:hypothetical protein